MDSSLILARLEKFEGRIPYMYRCTGGEVTIGLEPGAPVIARWPVERNLVVREDP